MILCVRVNSIRKPKQKKTAAIVEQGNRWIEKGMKALPLMHDT